MFVKEVRLLCVIGGESATAFYGYTRPEHDLVLISKSYLGGGMKSCELGDIVAFCPIPADATKKAPGAVTLAKWYAKYPRLVAKKFCVDPVTHDAQDTNAIAWKQKHEEAVDHKFQETR